MNAIASEGVRSVISAGTVYQVEPWATFNHEARALFGEHWREVALNHAEVPLDIDYDRYATMAASGKVHVVTARRAGKLIGYHVGFIDGHLHYKSTLHCVTDVYWIAPECRHGVTAIRLFQALEREVIKRGVRKIITGAKIHMGQERLFGFMGYTPADTLFVKIVGGA